MPKVSVIVPIYNVEKYIPKSLGSLKNQSLKDIEVICIDNGSTDNSVKISEELGARVVHCPDKGYGNALRFGFKNAIGKYIIMGDADNTYDFLEIPLLWNKKTEDTDMVIGTRLKGNIHKGAMPIPNRYLGTPVLTLVLNFLYGTRISDSQCGMRLMKRSSLEQINFKTTGMEFASELLVEFAKHKFKIVETPISLLKGPEGRIPHLNPIRDGLRHLRYLITNRFIYLFI